MEAGMLLMIAKLLPVAILILWCLSASSFACNLPDNKLQGSLLFLPVLQCAPSQAHTTAAGRGYTHCQIEAMRVPAYLVLAGRYTMLLACPAIYR
jgi:hypothetical protein